MKRVFHLTLAALALCLVVNTASAETMADTAGPDIVYSVYENGVELQVIRQANPAAGLESYLVKVVTELGAIRNLKIFDPVIDGEVHQCQPVSGGSVEPTLLYGQIPVYMTGWTDLHTATDTHLIIADSLYDIWQLGSPAPVEDNDGSNPCDLGTAGDSIRIGLGEITGGENVTYTRLGTESIPEMDLAQIVIPVGTKVYFNGRVSMTLPPNHADSVDAEFHDVPIGVPEPGSVALLIAGGLCLAASRMRRK